jgi:hypothetical protein
MDEYEDNCYKKHIGLFAKKGKTAADSTTDEMKKSEKAAQAK